MQQILRHPSEQPIHTGPIEVMELVRGSAARASSFQPGTLDISWFRSADYAVVLEHGGKEVTQRGLYTDGGLGVFSGLPSAVEAAKGVTRHFGVDANSSLEVLVRASLTDEPCIEVPKPSYSTFNHYEPVPRELYYLDLDMGRRWLGLAPDERLGTSLIRRVEASRLIEGEAWWSSRSGALATFTQIQDWTTRAFVLPQRVEA